MRYFVLGVFKSALEESGAHWYAAWDGVQVDHAYRAGKMIWTRGPVPLSEETVRLYIETETWLELKQKPRGGPI